MQILASALPGFRDLRAPVVAGYMWLVFAWLLVQPDPNQRPADSIGAALYDLGHDTGRLAIAIAAGVVAYLVGAISQSAATSAARLIRNANAWRLGERALRSGEDEIERILDRGKERIGERESTPPLDTVGFEYLRSLRGLLESPVSVEARGGTLTVSWAGGDNAVWMKGPARTVFEGEIEL